MADKQQTNDEVISDTESPKRGRPTGKARAKRQNYADDLRQLQARVEFAMRILHKIADLIQVAIETLEQEG